MMCRVPAPLAALFRREVTSRSPFRLSPAGPGPSLHRRLRIVRHRALRWFNEPIATIERDRRERDLAPSMWRYDFRPWPALRYAQLEPDRAQRRN